MRKQDRVAAARQEQGRQESEKQQRQPGPREQEKMKGAASTGQPPRPQRQGAKLPLPD